MKDKIQNKTNKNESDMYMYILIQGLSIDAGDIQKIRVCGGYEEDPESVWTIEKVLN